MVKANYKQSYIGNSGDQLSDSCTYRPTATNRVYRQIYLQTTIERIGTKLHFILALTIEWVIRIAFKATKKTLGTFPKMARGTVLSI